VVAGLAVAPVAEQVVVLVQEPAAPAQGPAVEQVPAREEAEILQQPTLPSLERRAAQRTPARR
jgi:hypothetical protein